MSRTRVLLASLGAITASVALVTTASLPADAAKAKPYVIKAGTQTKGTVAATGTTTGASPQIKFASSGVNMSCVSGTANTNIKLGKNKKGLGIATIPSTTFVNCKGPANLALTVTQVGTWTLNATGPVASNGDVPGSIVNVSAHVSAANASQCSFDVNGSVDGTFSQLPTTNQLLKVGDPAASHLTLSNVVGCFGLLANGAAATFAATYQVTNSVGPISITQ